MQKLMQTHRPSQAFITINHYEFAKNIKKAALSP
jgi:hypothetical protein